MIGKIIVAQVKDKLNKTVKITGVVMDKYSYKDIPYYLIKQKNGKITHILPINVIEVNNL